MLIMLIKNERDIAEIVQLARYSREHAPHKKQKLLTLEVELKDERLRSLSDTLETERTRHERDGTLVKILRTKLDEVNAMASAHLLELIKQREAAELAEVTNPNPAGASRGD